MEMIINSEKISRFLRCALRTALGALKDIGGKIVGIPQCSALGTTLLYVPLALSKGYGNSRIKKYLPVGLIEVVVHWCSLVEMDCYRKLSGFNLKYSIQYIIKL